MENKSNLSNIIKNSEELFFILGPCVIESEDHILRMAEKLKKLAEKLDFPLIFKSSFDKANRTSIASYRGPGLEKGLKILEKVKKRFDLPVLTDIHLPEQAQPVSEVVDILQIPAFLCRQTDIVIAAGETGNFVNVKKGQFLSPYDMKHIVKKIETTNNKNIMLTERGHKFGYNNLISDMCSIPIMKNIEGNYAVVFDATHSAQMPGGSRTTGGKREFIPALSRAAVAAGCDGIFMEVHDNPIEALSDSATQFPLKQVQPLLKKLIKLHELVRSKK